MHKVYAQTMIINMYRTYCIRVYIRRNKQNVDISKSRASHAIHKRFRVE